MGLHGLGFSLGGFAGSSAKLFSVAAKAAIKSQYNVAVVRIDVLSMEGTENKPVVDVVLKNLEDATLFAYEFCNGDIKKAAQMLKLAKLLKLAL